MNTLFRLALTLTVAVVASLTPVASAGPEDPGLDIAPWKSSDGGTCRFYTPVPKWDLIYGPYVSYQATHTHADGFQMEMVAVYWQNYDGLVTFSWKHGPDRGTGRWILGAGLNTLDGTWESKVGNGSGTWSLWR
jgi:hypothetical protein